MLTILDSSRTSQKGTVEVEGKQQLSEVCLAQAIRRASLGR